MKKCILVILVIFWAIIGSGCAGVATGKYQNVLVTSESPVAKVWGGLTDEGRATLLKY